MPPDPTSLEDMIHAALFSGQPAKALLYASQLDPWLAAHLADVMEPLSLISDNIIDESVLLNLYGCRCSCIFEGLNFPRVINTSFLTLNICIPTLPCGKSQLTTCILVGISVKAERTKVCSSA